jgi:general secretion pathway protein I
MKFSSRWMHQGISLLEVVLALSILAMAAAYLAQATHLATENAIRARTISQAEIVAESVINQIVAGVLPAQSVSWTGYVPPNSLAGGTGSSQWMYRIQTTGSEIRSMISVQVAVQEVRAERALNDQADLTVVRWIIDPQLGLDTPPDPSMQSSSGQITSGGTP